MCALGKGWYAHIVSMGTCTQYMVAMELLGDTRVSAWVGDYIINAILMINPFSVYLSPMTMTSYMVKVWVQGQ